MSEASSGGGIGFFGLLFIVLLTLKLTGAIDWSWWLITLPLWGPLTLLLFVVGLVFVVAVIAALVKGHKG